MGGIAGWVGLSREHSELEPMLDAIAHRGPDGRAHVARDCGARHEAVLGHVRFTSLDAEDGGQPMTSSDGRFTVVCDGVIYNYLELRTELEALGIRFRTRSDIEVLVEAWAVWGVAALERIRGMFALAIHDRDEGSVHFARDAFGQKPLFFYEAGETLYFASEIRGLLAHPHVPARLEDAAVYAYLKWRYVPAPGTFFGGVRKLLPGSFAVKRGETLTERRYWMPPEATRAPLYEGYPVDRFLETFDDAVALRLRSDVPVGVFLASGIDDAAVLESMARQGAFAEVYSAGYLDAEDEALEDARLIAETFGAPFHAVEMDPTRFLDLMVDTCLARTAPATEPWDVSVFALAEAAARDVKVVLSGEGAEAFFAGAHRHVHEARMRFGQGRIARAAGGVMQRSAKGRRYETGRALVAPDVETRLVSWVGALSDAERDAVWIGGKQREMHDPLPFEAASGASPLRRALHFDQTSWLPDHVLERNDRLTMSSSVELRSPFTDIELGKFSAELPDHWRLSRGVSKRILREAMKQRLPEQLLARKSRGFPSPVGRWMRGVLADAIGDMLLSETAHSGLFIDRDWTERTVQAHRAGDPRLDRTVWMLFSLELFLQSHFGR